MSDEMMPGAALEAPETFRSLAAPYWPRLLLAQGYQGGARWVALYVSGDKVCYNDGASSGTGDTILYLAYKRHSAIARHLAGAQLGSADEEAQARFRASSSMRIQIAIPVAICPRANNPFFAFLWRTRLQWRTSLLPARNWATGNNTDQERESNVRRVFGTTEGVSLPTHVFPVWAARSKGSPFWPEDGRPTARALLRAALLVLGSDR